MIGFGVPGDPKRVAAIRRIKQAALALFEAGEEDAVAVSELRCAEPGCPPIETVVALLRPGAPPRHVKIHKPAVEVTDEDLRAAILAGDHRHHE